MPTLLALLAAALPLYLFRFRIGPVPTTALEIFILVVILAWVVQKIRNSKFEIRNLLTGHPGLLIPILLFFLAATIGVFISPHLRAAAGLWRAYFVEPIIIFLIAVATVKTPRDRQLILYGLSIGALIVSVYAIVQKFTGIGIPPAWVDPATRRVTSVFGYPNAVGLYLGPLVPLLVVMAPLTLTLSPPAMPCPPATPALAWRAGGKQWRAGLKRGRGNKTPPSPSKERAWGEVILFGVTSIASLLAIIFSRSFGALAGVGTALVLMGLIVKKTRAWTVAAVVTVSLVIAFSPLRKPFAEEFLLQGFSGKLRIAMWAETIEMLRDRPLLGAGLAGYQDAVAPYHIYPWAEIYLYPHNIILNFWSEIGLLGLIAFGWLIAVLVRMAWRGCTRPSLRAHGDSVSENRMVPLGLLGSFTVILIHGLVDAPYFKNDLSVMCWLFAALTVAVSRDSIKNNNGSRRIDPAHCAD